MCSSEIENIKSELSSLADPERAVQSASFFQTGEGGYAEGDLFAGVTVPQQRKVAKKYAKELSLEETLELLRSHCHEYRLTALFVLVYRFERTDAEERETILKLYVENLAYVNNWDLVDSSAHKILGPWLFDRLPEKKPDLLFELARSEDLWKQRVAVIATLHFIRQGRFEETLKLADILLEHQHDLIHKAVGWMLREVGKRDFDREFVFLKERYRRMPRTMLRYAIEKFDPPLRKKFMTGAV